MPIVSTMPKDNHSMMQLYLDGPKNNFYTFFDVIENKKNKIRSNKVILESHKYLKNKTLYQIKSAQIKRINTSVKLSINRMQFGNSKTSLYIALRHLSVVSASDPI